MITHIGTISIFVDDQDRAKAFYTEKLGFELRADNPMYPGAETRWLTVAPAGAATEINLYKMDKNWPHYQNIKGETQAVTFYVQDLEGTVAQLKKQGVTVVNEPERQHWGAFATIADSEGNQLLLTEPS